jgi:hypothetical protein
MAPLYVQSSAQQEFEGLLKEAKDIGVEAVSVDVWWGLVLKDRDRPDWEYYHRIFQAVENAGLKIVPILATHKCGGGPGDNCLCEKAPPPGESEKCAIPLPDWLYTDIARQAGYSSEDMQYRSETGRLQDDALPPWLTEGENSPILVEFSRFYQLFRKEFESLAERGGFAEINISLGPTGELRYPSYNKGDGWQFPQRGHFQASSGPALKSFTHWMKTKYGNLENAVERCGIPSMTQNGTIASVYDRDFIEWYADALLAHGQRLLVAADAVFGGIYAKIPLGMKIPGVHWQLQCTSTYRMAEITAGLIRMDYDFNSEGQARLHDHGYNHIFEMITNTKRHIKKRHPDRDLILHFTALEMDNDPGCTMQSAVHGTSRAESLVYWISDGAGKWGVTLRGENALQFVGGAEDPWGENRNWGYISGAVDNGFYSGFTFLRLWDRRAWEFDKDDYKRFIEKHSR